MKLHYRPSEHPADLNPYQRLIVDGKEIQKGSLDTHLKFQQLTEGLDLTDKSLLDVGCNLGEMCRLALRSGARLVRGVDANRDYIQQARELGRFDGLSFDVQRAEHASGNWDVVIASALMHHADLNVELALQQFARIAPLTICDVLIDESDSLTDAPCYYYSESRDRFYPNRSAWAIVAGRYFGSVTEKGPAVSPDGSHRRVFWLSEPKAKPATALLVYGEGGVGKTSYAKELERGEGYEHLQLDQIFVEWRIVKEPSESMSVAAFVDGMWDANIPESVHRCKNYLSYHQTHITRWLSARINRDVVIEGYDPKYPEYRAMVEHCFSSLGWKTAYSVEIS